LKINKYDSLLAIIVPMNFVKPNFQDYPELIGSFDQPVISGGKDGASFRYSVPKFHYLAETMISF